MNVLNQMSGADWTAYNADCIEFVQGLPDNCIDFSIYSPPFANLYIYSDSERDMGNCKDDQEFIEHYKFLVKELYRCMTPGRLVAVHCKQLVNYKGRDGMAGLRDFRGAIIKAHEECGFSYHSEVTIWKDPVIEMQRTKAHGLLYKQLRADSSFSRQGMPEYLCIFRKWCEEGQEPKPVTHTKDSFPLDQWQQWASPVWMDIQQTNVLNGKISRTSEDEKHICPLQLDLIERALLLWSNRGDTVFSPFMGIGSEGYVSVKNGRKFIGTELKPEYWNQACDFLRAAEQDGKDLFS